MASLSIATGAIPAAASVEAIKSPKELLKKYGLRSRSKQNVITGERIPGSASNKFLQLIGQEKKEDAENTIKEVEKASSKERGMIFVFNLLLQTLKEIKATARSPAVVHTNYPRLIKRTFNLKKKARRLLYIIAYSSVLTDDDAPPDMRNLLKRIKSDFDLSSNRPTWAQDPTNWSEMYNDGDKDRWISPYYKLDFKIEAVESYIVLWKEKIDTAKRNALDKVIKKIAADRNPEYGPVYSSSIQKYDNKKGLVGPYAKIAKYLKDTPEHKKQVTEKLKRQEQDAAAASATKIQAIERGRIGRQMARAEKIRKAYHKRRRYTAIRRALHSGGRRRKKKTRKRRKGGRKKTHRKKKRRKRSKSRRKRRTRRTRRRRRIR